MNFGFWNFYNFYNRDLMFTQAKSPVGDHLAQTTFLLGIRLREMGHNVATLDMKPPDWPDRVFFIDYPTRLNPHFRQLLRLKHPEMRLFASEPPIVRPDNYTPRTHRLFQQVLTWKKDLAASDPAKYIFYRLSNKFYEADGTPPFAERKLCLLINSFMFSVHPRELYSERIRAIRWFEANAPGDFDLVGLDWDRPLFTGRLSLLNFPLRYAYRRVGGLNKIKVKRYPSYIGPNKVSKRETLKQYKFCLAYENSTEPDYLSEKLFDSFFAGCVPVYLGAPNVLETIPAETFIDKREYPTYENLHRRLSTMTEREYNRYLAAARDFVVSPAARPFTAEGFVDDFVARFAPA